jgi:hypothetical protein
MDADSRRALWCLVAVLLLCAGAWLTSARQPVDEESYRVRHGIPPLGVPHGTPPEDWPNALKQERARILELRRAQEGR